MATHHTVCNPPTLGSETSSCPGFPLPMNRFDLEFESGMLEGYKYNILYPGEKGIDKTKANKERATSNGANGLIDHKQMELYQKLLQAKISI